VDLVDEIFAAHWNTRYETVVEPMNAVMNFILGCM
jgi:hypothetical protein